MTRMKVNGCVLRNIFVFILFTSNFFELFEESSALEIKKELDNLYDSSSESTKISEETTQKSENEKNSTVEDSTPIDLTNFNYSTSFYENDETSTLLSSPEDSQSFSMGSSQVTTLKKTGDFSTQKSNDKTQNIFNGLFPSARKVTTEMKRNFSGNTTPDSSEKYTNFVTTDNTISTTDANVHQTSSVHESEISTTLSTSEASTYTEQSISFYDRTSISMNPNEETFPEERRYITTQMFDDTTQNNFHRTSSPIQTNTEIVSEYPLDSSDKYTKVFTTKITVLPTYMNENSTSTYTSEVTTEHSGPSKPTVLDIDEITSLGFRIKWKQAEEFYGVILVFDVEINVLGHNHFTSNDDMKCHTNNTITFKYNTTEKSFKFTEGLPDYNYKVSTRSRTTAGTSEFSEFKTVTTATIASTPIRDLIVTSSGHKITEDTYEYNVTLSFKKPCNTNGPFKSYLIEYSGYRDGFPNENFKIAKNDINETNIGLTLKNAEYDFTFKVFVITEQNYTSDAKNGHIKTISGVPPANPESIHYEINGENPTQIDIVLRKDVFNNSMGNIIYYAIILIPSNGSLNQKKFHHDEWCENWPLANETTFYFRNRCDIIQLTENSWNPFSENSNTLNICIGKSSDCLLNYYLREDTNYFIVTRGLTKNTYIDIYTLVKTGKYKSNFWLTLALIFFFFLLIACSIYIYSKKGKSIRIKFKRISNANAIEEAPRHVIAIKNMSSYYNKIADDHELLRQQYTDIEDETRAYKEKYVKSDFALKPENKRKNRYINILPYDENRVRLNIDEDDEISSDYINASYIKGFSGEIEYIASQGPLEHTCRDFWKMVIQENVTVIVMVSHFIENEKEKCFKYFPRNYENLLICEDLEVKCLTELQFDTYCVRTLLVRKDIRQYSVVHLQYLDWPDFGCPSGTSNMLFFCQEVRDRIKLEKGKMIVHCSAGVGRTGTLISLDILLQAVRKKKLISIFETVSQLRKQRTHMVQTEKQYVYLHTCIKDALENEALYLRESECHCEEHTYKNTLLNKKYIEGDLGIVEDESAF